MLFWIVLLLASLGILAGAKFRHTGNAQRGVPFSHGHRWALIYLVIACIVMILFLTKSPFLLAFVIIMFVGIILISYGTRKLTAHMSDTLGSLDDEPNMAGTGHAGEGNTMRSDAAAQMEVHQALEVLGLTTDAGREDVERAYKRLMQKIHPDHGGSTYFAIQLNNAKDSLLRKINNEANS